ncbi:MAG TPA: hypothetical protein VJB70_00450 [Candidatus Paceibacterota bacterium]
MTRFVLALLYIGTVLGIGTWMYLHNGKILEVIMASFAVACGLAFLLILHLTLVHYLKLIGGMLCGNLPSDLRTVDSWPHNKTPS